MIGEGLRAPIDDGLTPLLLVGPPAPVPAATLAAPAAAVAAAVEGEEEEEEEEDPGDGGRSRLADGGREGPTGIPALGMSTLTGLEKGLFPALELALRHTEYDLPCRSPASVYSSASPGSST